MYKVTDLFDLSHTRAADYLASFTYPHEALKGIKALIEEIGASLPADEFEHPQEFVWIARDAQIAPTAFIGDHVIIDHGTEVRQCAFIRGSALVGSGCVIGNSTELKNVIIFDSVQVPHYNYVGDSILGAYAHMGAGSITSNVKSDKALVVIKDGTERIETGIKKVGAFLGDHVEVGCGSVLNPGSVVGRNSSVYPISSVRGVVPENSIYKDRGEIADKV